MKKRIPWNKGIPHSEETKKRISKAKKGTAPWNKGLTKADPRVNQYCENRMGFSTNGWFEYGYKVLSIKGKRILEHHLVWLNESEWRFIPKGFIVHHINGNKTDNRIENLSCIPRDYHCWMHRGITLHNKTKRALAMGN